MAQWYSYTMKKTSVLIALLISSSYAFASYTGLGDITCDQVISGHEKKNKAGRYQVIDWMDGYVTGRNIESKTNRHKGKGLGDESLYYAVVNYCKKNPLHSTVEAAEFIYERQLD